MMSTPSLRKSRLLAAVSDVTRSSTSSRRSMVHWEEFDPGVVMKSCTLCHLPSVMGRALCRLSGEEEEAEREEEEDEEGILSNSKTSRPSCTNTLIKFEPLWAWSTTAFCFRVRMLKEMSVRWREISPLPRSDSVTLFWKVTLEIPADIENN